MIQIPAELFEYLGDVGLLRSPKVSGPYLQKDKVLRDTFINHVQLKLKTQSSYLIKNTYPYDIFCSDKLEHFVLFGTDAYFDHQDWEILTKIKYPGFKFYFQNNKESQSVKEISHIHLFKLRN